MYHVVTKPTWWDVWSERAEQVAELKRWETKLDQQKVQEALAIKVDLPVGASVFPAQTEVFRALELTPPEAVRVVLVGQDPYHDGSADGLAFSCSQRDKMPPSLVSIFERLRFEEGHSEGNDSLGAANPFDLSDWARQGVLLLNRVLTVEKGAANSHRKKGWKAFTDLVLEHLAEKSSAQFILLGGEAVKLVKKFDLDKKEPPRYVGSSHPSPNYGARDRALKGSPGFHAFMCKHHSIFSEVNRRLTQGSMPGQAIDWVGNRKLSELCR